jgi:3-oxoadipate enol-lactonase
MQKLHPLLLIHGFPHDHTVWDFQILGLRAVADIIAPDLRGFGVGSKVHVPEVMSMAEYALDLKLQLDTQEIDRVVLCGLSMGGYVAMSFQELFPERVKGLILCNTRAGADDEEAKRKRYEVAEKAFDPGMQVVARELLPKMLSEKTRMERAPVADAIHRMMIAQRPDAVAAAAQGMAIRPDRREFLKKVELPTLIMTGDNDPIMDLDTSKEMNKAISGSELVVIDDAAHLSNVDQPERFNEAIREFLKKIPD